jgi:hypothetical protein
MASIFFIGVAPHKLVVDVISFLDEGSNVQPEGCGKTEQFSGASA